MRTATITLILATTLGSLLSLAQQTPAPSTPSTQSAPPTPPRAAAPRRGTIPTASTKRSWEYPHTGEPPLPPVKPLFDTGLRDTAICSSPDGTYYLTGTIGPDFMVANDGIHVWKSKDLEHWDSLGLVWSFDKDGTWQEAMDQQKGTGDALARPLWAPEMHVIKGNFYIAYCVTGTGHRHPLGTTSARPKGPTKASTPPTPPSPPASMPPFLKMMMARSTSSTATATSPA